MAARPYIPVKNNQSDVASGTNDMIIPGLLVKGSNLVASGLATIVDTDYVQFLYDVRSVYNGGVSDLTLSVNPTFNDDDAPTDSEYFNVTIEAGKGTPVPHVKFNKMNKSAATGYDAATTYYQF